MIVMRISMDELNKTMDRWIGEQEMNRWINDKWM